jgi:hypothetical protein
VIFVLSIFILLFDLIFVKLINANVYEIHQTILAIHFHYQGIAVRVKRVTFFPVWNIIKERFVLETGGSAFSPPQILQPLDVSAL